MNKHVIVRNNLFSDIEGTAVIALGRADYWDVYNNIFTCTAGHPNSCGVGNGIIGTTDHGEVLEINKRAAESDLLCRKAAIVGRTPERKMCRTPNRAVAWP